MYTKLPDGRVRFRRPYPVDIERRRNVRRVLIDFGMNSVSELARKTNISQAILSQIISGTRHSIETENKIAAFFGMEHDALFPPRSLPQMLAMEDEAAKKRKKRRAA